MSRLAVSECPPPLTGGQRHGSKGCWDGAMYTSDLTPGCPRLTHITGSADKHKPKLHEGQRRRRLSGPGGAGARARPGHCGCRWLCRERPAGGWATGLDSGGLSGGPGKTLSSRIRAISVSLTLFRNLLLNVTHDSVVGVRGGVCEESPKQPAPRPQAPQPWGQSPKPSMAETSWP